MGVSALHKRFVTVLAWTGSRERAAKAVGISRESARHALQSPEVQRVMKEAMQGKLAEIAPTALKVMERLATDETMPPAVRRLAAADILDRAGLISQAALQLGKPVENLSELPADDLRVLVERLESELFNRARPIEPPSGPPIDANPLNILD
jgi:hypothetical protein